MASTCSRPQGRFSFPVAPGNKQLGPSINTLRAFVREMFEEVSRGQGIGPIFRAAKNGHTERVHRSFLKALEL